VDVVAYLAERAALVDRLLDRAVPPAAEPPAQLHAAMRHLLFPGGKRIRPALAFAGAEAVGGRPEQALPLAAAVELVHTYSLVHDDLPCMDDDDVRRGKPTVHVAFGEAVAVLAGDALLAAAFEVLAGAPAASIRELARAAGSRALVGGQADDLALDAADADAARIESIHQRKTGALLAVAVVEGARLAGAGEPALARLRRLGECLGTGFQIADDLLDRRADEASSLVRVLGEDAARRRAEALLDEALAQVEGWGERAEPLRELARFAVRRER
jgi:geranylgeranyl diphosphate synthase type II